MSITFREFVELVEGKKKKEIKRLKSAYLAGQEQAPRQIVNYGDSAPNSPERAAQVAAMMRDSGGGAVRKEIAKKEKKAEKAAKNILNQEGFSYGSKSFQQELEKKRKEAEKQKQQERQQRSSELYHERTRGPGMVSYEKDESGVVRRGRRKDGKFTPDADT
jgi:hypothetical protein